MIDRADRPVGRRSMIGVSFALERS